MPTKIRFANREISRVFRIFYRLSLNLNIWNSLAIRSGSGDYTDWEDSICFCLLGNFPFLVPGENDNVNGRIRVLV